MVPARCAARIAATVSAKAAPKTTNEAAPPRQRRAYSCAKIPELAQQDGGGGSGIRTHVTVSRKHAFQASAFSHSATPPASLAHGDRRGLLQAKIRAGHGLSRQLDQPRQHYALLCLFYE